MRFDCCCENITIDEWNRLMRNAKPCSYKRLVKMIKSELPDLYDRLALEFPNPYASMCRQTKTHYILVHSLIEYFILKNDYP